MTKNLALILAALALAACSKTPADGPVNAPAAAATAPADAARLDQPEDVTPPASASEMYAAKLDATLAGKWRSDEERARDPFRHPAETLAFFQVTPDLTVLEITPGGGWYAKVLAPWLEGTGQYIAAVEKSDDPESYAAKARATLETLIRKHPAQFAKAEIVDFDPKAPVFGAPGSVDRVLTFRNVHNWAMAGTAEAMFKGFFDVLKPGGVLGVVDHRASEGAAFDEVKDSGYLPLPYVVKLATDAGFVLDAESEINANARDDHQHEKGVWTLPPTYALGDTDRQKYQDIGESDRMTLRFVKPKPDAIHSTGMDNAGKP